MARYTDTFVFAVALFLFSGLHFGDAWNIRFPQPTVAAQLLRRNATLLMDRRDEIVTDMTTCGYLNGDPKKIRTANSGFNCRVDTLRGIWGFCPTTVIAATDCGFAVACIDSKSCSDGCGQLDNTKLTTWTCKSQEFCSTALLTFGVDQTYTNLGCGGRPVTDHYLISPTVQVEPSTTSEKVTTSESPSPTSTRASSSASSSAQPPATGSPTDIGSTTRATSAADATSPVAFSSQSSTPNTNDTKPQSNTGAIIGGVIGGIALLCIFGIAAIYLLRRNKSSRSRRPAISPPSSVDGPWYGQETKRKNRMTGGWGPKELQGSSYDKPPSHPVELPS